MVDFQDVAWRADDLEEDLDEAEYEDIDDMEANFISLLISPTINIICLPSV